MAKHNFTTLPQVRFSRSQFDLNHSVKTTMNVGTLYPIDWQEVLPGDTISCDFNNVTRITSAFIKPVIDDAFMDIYHFFVPLRLVYDKAEEIFGVANPSAYAEDMLEDLPTFETNEVCTAGTVADYLGLPLGTLPKGIQILPFRAFALIYNQWFRNENVTDEVYIQKGDLADSERLNNNEWSPNNYMGKLPKVNKRKDYFTSALPNTQKGRAINLPLGSFAPVIGNGTAIGLTDGSFNYGMSGMTTNSMVRTMATITDYGKDIGVAHITGNNPQNVTLGLTTDPDNSGLVADLTQATSANVNDLRLAFQLQKMLERDALYGSRYNEYILGHFGVTNPDARLQFAEYLGGSRMPIMVQQVAQTSQTSENSPQANVSGYSLSNGKSHFAKSFTEHGYIFTVACIRTIHSYQQGVPRAFMRKSRDDFYDPLFANLGEQPVYRAQIYAQGENSVKDTPFGYQEAWAEYRYLPNKITGGLRNGSGQGLDIWHFGDYYSSAPILSQQFVEETPVNMARTLAVEDTENLDQFLIDGNFRMKGVRVMPPYSVPGLIDHH